MKKKNYKYISVFVFILLTAASVITASKTDRAGGEGLPAIETAGDLAGRKLGGVKTRMGSEAAGIYFESMLGQDIYSYREYDDFETATQGLLNGDVDALWATDVTAEYAVSVNDGLKILDSSQLAATANLPAPRFYFAMSLRSDKESRNLCDLLSRTIDGMNSDGTCGSLASDYITHADIMEPYREEDMWSRSDRYKSLHEVKDTITVGITGDVPPVEMIDENGEPYGYCIAFLDEVACRLDRKVVPVVLDPATAYSSLMAGRVDALFTGATANNTTQETREYITTTGFLKMSNYKFLIRDAGKVED